MKLCVTGRLGFSGEPVVTTLVCFFILHARLWVRRAPGFPCALCFRGQTILANLGCYPRRGIAEARASCPGRKPQHERSEMMRCRTGTHPFRGTHRSRFCEAALHAAIHARDTKRRRGMTAGANPPRHCEERELRSNPFFPYAT